MKSLITLVFVLVINFSYSQEINDDLHNKIFNNIEESQYLLKNDISKKSEEIRLLELLKPVNNSEGKFPLYKFNNDKSFNTYILTNTIEKKDVKKQKSNAILTRDEVNFINDIIIKKQLDINFIADEEALVFGDRGIMLKRYVDILNPSFKLNSTVRIQIGKNLNEYINKLHKSEIDKTLQNSLNLLAISF